MEVRAQARYIRVSPIKVRRIIATVKGKQVADGLNTLRFMPQKPARMLDKLIRSAAANAENNHGLNVDNLVILNITADQGPALKRWRARARGRGARILKPTAHIAVVLSDNAKEV